MTFVKHIFSLALYDIYRIWPSILLVRKDVNCQG